jgi:hypothetical protein
MAVCRKLAAGFADRIRAGGIEWADKWTPDQIVAGRSGEEARRKAYYEAVYRKSQQRDFAVSAAGGGARTTGSDTAPVLERTYPGKPVTASQF